MNQKFIISMCAALLVILLVTGYIAVAADDYGSESDPLVTVSYIENVLKEQTENEAKDIADDLAAEYEMKLESDMEDFAQELDSKLAEFEKELSSLVSDSGFIEDVADEVMAKGGEINTSLSTWQVVNVASGKTVSAKMGTEILLRIGTANCYSPGGTGIINLSSGTELSSGKPLSMNNLYIVTIDDRGFTATSDVTVLINGDYTQN